MLRTLVATLVASLAALLLASVAFGGGWAHIQPDQATFEPPAGRPTEFGFTVLQHGQTPVSWVHPSVVVTDLMAGSSRTYPATQSGPEGHFVASITLASPGLHTWEVTMSDLIVEASPVTFVALNADGGVPAISPAVVLQLAIEAVEAQRDQPVSEPPAPTVVEPAGPSMTAISARVDALATGMTSLRSELTMMRVLLIGLAASVVAIIGVAAVLAWPRRRASVGVEGPASEAVLGG
ncbi:MAG TPA: hypothetical protein VJZ72_08355 [Candidatus Limnocylindrales bacterium]|nr:hypothetical protein [Candidatus Limnocylindrales bacterium]